MLLENFKRKRRTFHLLRALNEDSVFLGETKLRKWVTGSRYLEVTLFGRHKSSVSPSHRLKWWQYVSSKCRDPPSAYTLTPFRIPGKQHSLLHHCWNLKPHIKRKFYRHFLRKIFVRFYAQGLGLYATYFSHFQINEPRVDVWKIFTFK
jgi:hypothetical protein